MSWSDRITTALQRAAGFEKINAVPSETQLRITGRVHADNSQRWLVLVKHLLVAAASEEEPWAVDISRMYFAREDEHDYKLFYSWRIIISFKGNTQAVSLAAVESVLVDLYPAAQAADLPDEVDVPLMASSTRMGLGKNGKGARSVVG